jgi:SAM-dependent methyltransferase
VGRYQRTAELAALGAVGVTGCGPRVADLGCGSGRLTRALLAGGHPPAIVHALDRTSDLDDDLLTDRRVRSVIADLDDPLPFADASLERVVSVNLIEHLADPGRLLAEIARVLVVDGLVHSDWDTMLFTGSDDGLTRRLVDRFVSAMPGWACRADGFAGRRLLSLVAAAQREGAAVEVVAVDSWADPHRRFDDDSVASKVATGIAMAGAADPTLAPAVAGWLHGLDEAAAAGRFLFTVTDVAVVLRRRGG